MKKKNEKDSKHQEVNNDLKKEYEELRKNYTILFRQHKELKRDFDRMEYQLNEARREILSVKLKANMVLTLEERDIASKLLQRRG